ncbi:hypothetical protein BDQ12DRAFT_651084 [Crucibulum laeve]|uniref:FAD/NAD(P)-binding domain-containing protein n=1 Tax=Crucibulum laeve TaxID=68775 RepID=A0A5C3M0S8_9AGAR|nr:hypothetical protein BDQ12DRAFT_651084 [Crucibulum laeve]
MVEATTQEYEKFDVIIVGGGLAGCSTALSIRRSYPRASILLLDDTDPTAFKIGESLPAEGKKVLAYLSPQLLARFADDLSNDTHVRCTGNAFAWNTEELEEKYAILNLFGMGWHLDRAKFDQALRDVGAAEGVKIVRGSFLDVRRGEGPYVWNVTGKNIGSQSTTAFQSRIVVDASGRKASLARKLGAKTIKRDTLLALYTIFHLTAGVEDPDYRTIIEASESGWWYTSQLPNSKRVVVYHTDESDPTSRIARKQDGFLNLLHSETSHISTLILEQKYDLLRDSGIQHPRCTVACSSYLEPCCDQGAPSEWYAVGDAAMAFDPLSSQGMITALKMGCIVGDAIGRQLEALQPVVETRNVVDNYMLVRAKYEKEKLYFYRQVDRFNGEFWRRRQESTH